MELAAPIPSKACTVDNSSLFDSSDSDLPPTTKKKAKKAEVDDAPAPAPKGKGSAGARDISVAEFFEKNRHMLGFDSPSKAILMAVKEAVDNSLDACEEAMILPTIRVELEQTGEKFFKVCIEDNGPGIPDTHIGKIFGKLLYGSKFHKLSQSRGQQGIGISAAGMYGKLTTGKPVRVISKTKRGRPIEAILSIDSLRNKPEIHSSEEIEWPDRKHGTRVEIEMEATYKKGIRSVDMYLKQTAIANPHLTLTFVDPAGEEFVYERNTKEKPPKTVDIKPHPHGVEMGRLITMLKETSCRSVSGFLQEEFCRVGPTLAKRIVKAAGNGLTE
ncbi:MAG: DNA topoisomerase VI subunit B, partial [Planctomycetota bacterium]|nr:DNA topoisomerase VI subunit B [Planctomycetota bacterium]